MTQVGSFQMAKVKADHQQTHGKRHRGQEKRQAANRFEHPDSKNIDGGGKQERPGRQAAKVDISGHPKTPGDIAGKVRGLVAVEQTLNKTNPAYDSRQNPQAP